jgi:hypothetical protein
MKQQVRYYDQELNGFPVESLRRAARAGWKPFALPKEASQVWHP